MNAMSATSHFQYTYIFARLCIRWCCFFVVYLSGADRGEETAIA